MARLPRTPKGLANRVADGVLAERLAEYDLAPDDLPESIDIRELGKMHIPMSSLLKALRETNFVRNQVIAVAEQEGVNVAAEQFAEYL